MKKVFDFIIKRELILLLFSFFIFAYYVVIYQKNQLEKDNKEGEARIADEPIPYYDPSQHGGSGMK